VEVFRRPDVTWRRKWLHPDGPGQLGPPERRRLLTWFGGGLERESDGLFFTPAAGGANTPSPVIGVSLHIPYWSVVLLAMVLPGASRTRSWRSSRRRRAGRCANCGYDLRATPDRCPECNTECITSTET
jgi:hypothetical protein